MKDLVEFYRKMLGFEDVYGIIKHRAIQAKEENRYYIRQSVYPSFLQGYNEIIINHDDIQKKKGDLKTDVPVWFGNPHVKPRQRILVVGKEPHARSKRFYIEKIPSKGIKTIYSAIFGADQWNDANGKNAIHNAYLHAFKPLLNKANEGAICVIFTDLVKRVPACSHTAPTEYSMNANKWKSAFIQEIDQIKPCKIIALGQCVCCVLHSWMIPNVIHVRHPAHNGAPVTKKQIREILKAFFTYNKINRCKRTN